VPRDLLDLFYKAAEGVPHVTSINVTYKICRIDCKLHWTDVIRYKQNIS